MGKKGIPDRWLDYSSMGRQISGTRFIAFKVPLKESMLRNLPSTQDLFDTRAVMDHISNLGMVIDLTNTDRYYDPTDFQKNNIIYHKLMTGGHIIPSESVFRKFCFLVENFIEQNKNNEKIIGVHCTHGLNRTGYMICRYMIQLLEVAPDQVISNFDSARGYHIERENYLEDLRKASWPKFVVSKEIPRSNYRRNSFTSPKYDNNYSYNRRMSNPRYLEFDAQNNHWDQDNNQATSEYLPRRQFRSPYSRNDQSGYTPTYDRRSSRHHWERRSFQSPDANYSNKSRKSFESNEVENYGNKSFEFNMPSFADSDKNIDMGPSLVAGKEYYQAYFGKETSSQYDSEFYNRGGGDLGPHRPHHRYIPPKVGAVPRQYRGPRQYKSPSPKLDENQDTKESSTDIEKPLPFSTPHRSLGSILNKSTPQQTFTPNKSPSSRDHLRTVNGPGRSVLSPGAKNNVFSPELEHNARRRRYQPY